MASQLGRASAGPAGSAFAAGASVRNAAAAGRRLILASAGSPLASSGQRRRAVGRIGGVVGAFGPEALTRLERSLGPGAQLLPRGAPVVADFDACRRRGEPLGDLRAWRRVLDAAAWGEVEGAFAVAGSVAPGHLVLARDALGERSLYYAVLKEGVVFASTLRALLASGLVPGGLNLRALARYLAYAYLPGEETLVLGVDKLLPGEVLELSAGHLSRRRHWSLAAEQAAPGSEAELRTLLRERLENAVRRLLPEGGERLAAFLSGGLDSSLVVALARRLHEGPVASYSVSFGPGYPNELAFSSQVAEHCGTEHRVLELSPAVVRHHLDDAISLLSDPIGDPLTVPNALLFREAAGEAGVVLNGEGGDPCFGGPKNLPMLLAELLGDGANADGGEAFLRERSYLRAHQKCYDDLPGMLADDALLALADQPLERQLAPHLGDARFASFVTRLMALNVEFKSASHILPKVDSVSAPFGVVARAPLFDRAVVELAFRIPPQLKLRGAVEKYLLKEAVKDLLPAAIVERPKSGMLVPVEGWFQGPLLGEAKARILDGLAPLRLFRRDYLERLLAGRLGGLRPRRGAKIWLLVTLESWLRTVLGAP